MQVFGCYQNSPYRAIEGADVWKDDKGVAYDNSNYGNKPNAIVDCANFAKSRGQPVFAVQDSGQCMTQSDAHLTYDKYQTSTACQNGKGAGSDNHVYKWN